MMNKKNKKAINLTLMMGMGLLMSSSAVLAADPGLTITNTFESDQPATAEAMNQNFTDVKMVVDPLSTMVNAWAGVLGADKPASTVVTDALGVRIKTNTTGVADNNAAMLNNAAGITANQARSSKNSAQIQNNALNIRGNGGQIQTNAEAITTNTTGVAANAKGIAGTRTDMKTIAVDVVTNTKGVAANTQGVAGNRAASSKNSLRIDKNVGGIAANAEGVVTNAVGITANKTASSKNSLRIDKNVGGIAANTEGVVTNASNINGNGGKIQNNALDIKGNGGQILTNASKIGGNGGLIQTNASRINGNGGQIQTNALSISGNGGQIQTNALRINGNDGLIRNNANDVAVNRTGMNTLAGAVEFNTASVTYNTSGVRANTTGVAVNREGMLFIREDVAASTQQVTASTQLVKDLAIDVAGSTELVNTFAGLIDNNKINVAINETDIAALADQAVMPGTKPGDMLYWDATNSSWVLLPSVANNATLNICKGIPTWKPCSYIVGDTGPGGGIVFSVTANGLHGMEARVSDVGSAYWGCLSINVNGANSAFQYRGSVNTDNIMSQCPEGRFAAGLTRDVRSFSSVSTGWHLPTRDDMTLLYSTAVLPKAAAKGLAVKPLAGIYWTSTQVDVATAIAFDLVKKGLRYGKGSVFSVRPIRHF